MKNIAKLTSYGCYLDCDFVTAKYPEEETHIVGNVAEYVYDLEQKISDLEAKLAEKEKEITKLKSDNHSLMSDNAYQEADIFELKQKLAIQNQDKISFALEQLEKVKEDILLDISIGIQREWISNKIDNQIKQLKEIM